jgi:hypothetical protein
LAPCGASAGTSSIGPLLPVRWLSTPHSLPFHRTHLPVLPLIFPFSHQLVTVLPLGPRCLALVWFARCVIFSCSLFGAPPGLVHCSHDHCLFIVFFFCPGQVPRAFPVRLHFLSSWLHLSWRTSPLPLASPHSASSESSTQWCVRISFHLSCIIIVSHNCSDIFIFSISHRLLCPARTAFVTTVSVFVMQLVFVSAATG